MTRISKSLLISVIGLSALCGQAWSQDGSSPKNKALHVVGTAHFDTQWQWTIQTSINEYLPNTFNDNFKLFEKYPDYKFSFEGAIKYMLMKEYYPEAYQRVKEYIAGGQWNICGSSLDATDVNIPSPESVIRTILIGQNYYKKEFGVKSYDIFLPDCFGFGYALPTIMHHCGLTGFSTQKLTWGAPFGVPFDIGTWTGVDGSRVFAGLNAGSYGAHLRGDLSKDEKWNATVDKTGQKSGIYLGYRYFGTGDVGGAPEDSSVYYLEKAIHSDGPLKVISAPADLMARQMTSEQLDKLPQFNGELLTSPHGNGCYSSQAAMKLLNRKNEILADAAERSSIMSSWLGSTYYPKSTLQEAWIRFLWHQFHDDLTGTSLAEVYRFSWNDELLSQNQFAGVLENSAGGIIRGLDTRTGGIPVVIYNPLSIDREDLVEANVELPGQFTEVRVYDETGKEVPAQVINMNGRTAKVIIAAHCLPVSYQVYDVVPSAKACTIATGLSVKKNQLENNRYKVVIDKNGDVSSIFDKQAKRELLKSPIRLEMLDDKSVSWPAWEIMYEAVTKAPRTCFDRPVISITENGPARISLCVVRIKDGSELKQYISLAAGAAGDRVEFSNELEWNTQGTLLKAAFPLAVTNPQATYDLGIGTIKRDNNQKKLYEVPAQQWADLTNTDNSYGVTVMSDYKLGWDKPADNQIRLTLVHTPATGRGYMDQATNDIGFHNFSYAIGGHKGDWREGGSQWAATRLNQPLVAFNAPKHEGSLGKSFSMLKVSNSQVAVKALKQAELTEEVVVRVQELFGKDAKKVKVTFPTGIISAREVNGIEETIGKAIVENGQLVFDMKSYEPKTFALTIDKPTNTLSKKTSQWLALNYDIDGISYDADRTDGDFDGKGNTFPAELWMPEIVANDVVFKMGSAADGQKNFVSAKGQVVNLPEGKFNTVYILASSADGDINAEFKVDGKPVKVNIPYYSGNIGQWDNRDLSRGFKQSVRINGVVHPRPIATLPAFIKHVPVGYIATHRHLGKTNENEAYIFGYLFTVAIHVPAGAKTLQLPDMKGLRIAAVTVSDDANRLSKPAAQISVDFSRDLAKAKAVAAKINEPVSFEGVKAMPASKSDVAGLKPGLKWAYYEGRWRRLPDWSKLTPLKTGTSMTPELPVNHAPEFFGVVYDGYINVPADGNYTFYTTSDDGSSLMIDDVLITDNDGAHGQS
ncbi:MAG: glycoside hydrolase family 38 C-terminal domain-containing protein, partial [Bacteroidales bacterium]|nr:glycoside hydrolase family 38 C-terminal domain-containing protein [Bacteroidales bacterium]